jgi:hypothetical protein
MYKSPQEERNDGDCDQGETVPDIHRSKEVTFLAFKLEIACGTAFTHGWE